jgi:hypothetical protein
MARWRRHRRRLRHKIPSMAPIIAQSALRSFWSRLRSRRSHRRCWCRLVSNGPSILLITHRRWPSRRAWPSDPALRPPPELRSITLWRRGTFLFIAAVIRPRANAPSGKRGFFFIPGQAICPRQHDRSSAGCLADFAALESRANVEWKLSLAHIGVTAMVDWAILTGVIVVVVAMYLLERG